MSYEIELCYMTDRARVLSIADDGVEREDMYSSFFYCLYVARIELNHN